MISQYSTCNIEGLENRERIKDKSLLLPKISAEFFVRLYTLLETDPEITYEGYEFYIQDNNTGKKFSAGLTGFGVGYFAAENSHEMLELIETFDKLLFNELNNLKECRIEIENDFGKSIFGFNNNQIIEIDVEE